MNLGPIGLFLTNVSKFISDLGKIQKTLGFWRTMILLIIVFIFAVVVIRDLQSFVLEALRVIIQAALAAFFISYCIFPLRTGFYYRYWWRESHATPPRTTEAKIKPAFLLAFID